MSEQRATAGPLTVDDWDAHWDDMEELAERNPAMRYRRVQGLKYLARDGVPERFLDIGSGTGEFLIDAEKAWPTAELAGVEMSAHGNELARRRLGDVRLFTVDLIEEDSPTELQGWATHAFCSEVIEHVDDPVEFLRRSRKMLAPGAQLMVTVPGGKMSSLDHHIGHRRHFSPDDLDSVFREAGLEPVLTTGLGFPAFNIWRKVVIGRGDAILDDAAGDLSTTTKIGMKLFEPLFAVSFASRRYGLQTAGIAREPE